MENGREISLTIILAASLNTKEGLMLLNSRTLQRGIGSLVLLYIGVELVRGRRERSTIISMIRRTSTFTPVVHGSTVTTDSLSSFSTITQDPNLNCNTSSSSLIVTRCKCQLKVVLSVLSRTRSTLLQIFVRMIGTVMRTLSTCKPC